MDGKSDEIPLKRTSSGGKVCFAFDRYVITQDRMRIQKRSCRVSE